MSNDQNQSRHQLGKTQKRSFYKLISTVQYLKYWFEVVCMIIWYCLCWHYNIINMIRNIIRYETTMKWTESYAAVWSSLEHTRSIMHFFQIDTRNCNSFALFIIINSLLMKEKNIQNKRFKEYHTDYISKDSIIFRSNIWKNIQKNK